MTKILIISEIYKKGGAGNATSNIFQFLSKNFGEVKLLIPYLKKKEKNVLSYFNIFTVLIYFFTKLFNRFFSFFITKNKFYFFHKLYDFSLFSTNKIYKKINTFKPDIVIILWFEYILNYEEILKIKNKFNTKIILLPFDMFNFTGGCRYTQACENYINECNNCPALQNNLKKIAVNNYNKNKKLIKKIEPKFIFPSTFARDFAISSKILCNEKSNYIISYPISSINLNEKDSYIMQKIKEETKGYKVLFLGAQDLREWRKGMHNFVNVISIFKTNYSDFFSKIKIISVGKNSSKILSNFKKNSICLESLKLKDLFSVYRHSDLIIIPSLQEWSSLMMSEAISLDKVVFSFDTGSSKDLIKDYVNGFVFSPFDYNHIVKKMYHYLSDPNSFFSHGNKEYLSKIKKKYDNEFLKQNYQKIF